MDNADFQDRLRRIGGNSAQQQPMTQDTSQAVQPSTRKLDYGRFGLGAVVMALGGQAVKYVNENYDAIRDSSGIGTVVGVGLAGAAVFLFGISVMARTAYERWTAPAGAAASSHSAKVVQPVRQASTTAKVICSLLGFAFGTIACFYILMAGAMRYLGTEKAELFVLGSIVIATLLVFVSLLFGIVGLFLRGYALGRVPVYLLFGVVLTFSAVRIFGINMLEWQPLMAQLQ